jgi:hypothetical protein
VAEGTPQYVASVAHSHTGEFLRRYYAQTAISPAAIFPVPPPSAIANGSGVKLRAKAPSPRTAPRPKAELVS